MKRALVAYSTDSESDNEVVSPPNKKRHVHDRFLASLRN
jgi:hypothetical protein